MTFTSIQQLIPKAARKYGIYKTMRAIEVCREAEKVLDELFKNREHGQMKARSFSDGELKIKVANSSWAQEVFLHRKTLLNQVNERIDRKAVKSVKITTKSA
ncbi:MAG: DciA family protein [Patescibacteria group bacterium]|nr:DUF721 domain-containing protein [Patescibacteria group bacterium]